MKSRDKYRDIAHLFVITGPSGCGKSTIINLLMQRIDDIAYSVSHTTRKPREGEIEGKDYYFVDKSTFQKMIDCGEFIEWAEVYSDLYGTSFLEVREKLKRGTDMILDLDIQGAMNIRSHFKNSTLIFLLAPSLEELKKRLKKRGTEPAVIEKRLSRASDEIRMAGEYDYIVVNDVIEKAVKEIEAIVISERCRASKRLSLIYSMFNK